MIFNAVEKMRGSAHAPITLRIVRRGIAEPFDVKIVRDVIHVDPVKYEADDDVGYIRITTFNEQTAAALQQAIDDLNEKIGPRLKGYVIDLRNNPGGLLEQAVMASASFLDQGKIVAIKARDPEEEQHYDAQLSDLTKGAKLVVLINGGSASASEIVAGALQDDHRATVVGTRSFGKGSVQTIIPLANQGALRLIQAEGIEPDVVITEENPSKSKEKAEAKDVVSEASLHGHLKNEGEAANGKQEELGSSSYVNPDKAKDTQLVYALDLLHGVDSMSSDAAKKRAEAN